MHHPRIQSDPKVIMGKPVIRGTRITVEHILRCLAAGDSIDQLLADYPRLTVEDIRAAQAFTAWEHIEAGVAQVRDMEPVSGENVCAEEKSLAAQVKAARREN